MQVATTGIYRKRGSRDGELESILHTPRCSIHYGPVISGKLRDWWLLCDRCAITVSRRSSPEVSVSDADAIQAAVKEETCGPRVPPNIDLDDGLG